jgi:hypothetical protein
LADVVGPARDLANRIARTDTAIDGAGVHDYDTFLASADSVDVNSEIVIGNL